MELIELKKNNFTSYKGMDVTKTEYADFKGELQAIIININEYSFMVDYARKMNKSKLSHLYEYKLKQQKELLKDTIRLNKEYYTIKIEV